MSEELDPKFVDECMSKGPQSVLERRFIREYLHSKGYRLEELKKLPENEMKELHGMAVWAPTDAEIREIERRSPGVFGSNHAPFLHH